MTFEAADQVSWAAGQGLDSPFEELVSTSRVAGEVCPWASSTARACPTPTWWSDLLLLKGASWWSTLALKELPSVTTWSEPRANLKTNTYRQIVAFACSELPRIDTTDGPVFVLNEDSASIKYKISYTMKSFRLCVRPRPCLTLKCCTSNVKSNIHL